MGQGRGIDKGICRSLRYSNCVKVSMCIILLQDGIFQVVSCWRKLEIFLDSKINELKLRVKYFYLMLVIFRRVIMRESFDQDNVFSQLMYM